MEPVPSVSTTATAVARLFQSATTAVRVLSQSTALPPTPPSTFAAASPGGAKATRWCTTESGRGRYQPSTRPNQAQNPAPEQALAQNLKKAEGEKGSEDGSIDAGSSGTAQDKNLQVVCFNCGEIGHLNSAYSRPRVCFICQSTNHVVELCPEWKKNPCSCSILWKC